MVTIDVHDDGAGGSAHRTDDGGAQADASPGIGPAVWDRTRARRHGRAGPDLYSGTVTAGPGGRGWRVHAVLTCPADDRPEPISAPPELQGKA